MLQNFILGILGLNWVPFVVSGGVLIIGCVTIMIKGNCYDVGHGQTKMTPISDSKDMSFYEHLSLVKEMMSETRNN